MRAARSSETCITNYHGPCPGDFRLDPLFARLNRRRAVVFMHPASPKCPCCQAQSLCCPRPVIEFMFEITRAVANLLLTGTFAHFADIQWIIPHAGAPVLADHVLYGSDGPFTPLPTVSRLAADIDATSLFDADMRRRVLCDNALTLFPKLRA